MNISANLLKFRNGKIMKNRFMLAPMTNTMSFENGHLSDDEYKWLTMRAAGQFGMVMTCASHVNEFGKGFPGQLAIYSDEFIEDHKRLAAGIKEHGSLAVVQLHHAGMRSPKKLIGRDPVAPYDNEEYGAVALTLEEIAELKNDFIEAAVRAEKCGYDGIQVHGAHGYILTQFLNIDENRRSDEYGGSIDNRGRIIFEILEGIREKCSKEFLVGIRISPERSGMELCEAKYICQKIIDQGFTDTLDISLWDSFKYPYDEKYSEKTLLEHFQEIDFKDVKYSVAGNVHTGEDVIKVLDTGVDFVAIGHSGILHHDFPAKVMEDTEFKPIEPPVTLDHLRNEGLGQKFLDYISRWPDFIKK
ncbi:MAG: NADH:flavin oxidoreductase [Candidatus Delongbacteria bacterium]|nr:NADH:flavin oxidoreductase [Candidatus Delongbacteria bacterium]